MNDSITKQELSKTPNQPEYKQVYEKNTSQEYTSAVEGEIIKQKQPKQRPKKGKAIPNNNAQKTSRNTNEGEIIKQKKTKQRPKIRKPIPNNNAQKTSRNTNDDEIITTTTAVDQNFLNYLLKLVQEKNQSHPSFSIIQLSKNKTKHTVGDYLHIKIVLYDELGRPLTRGGDSVRTWGTGSKGKSNVAGDVIDHNNGSYTGKILLPWKGIINIHTRISETLQVGIFNVY